MWNGGVTQAQPFHDPNTTVAPTAYLNDFRESGCEVLQRVRGKTPKVNWIVMDWIYETGCVDRHATRLEQSEGFAECFMRIAFDVLQDLIADDEIERSILERIQIRDGVVRIVRLDYFGGAEAENVHKLI